MRDIYAYFAHGFDRELIEPPSLKPCAVCLKSTTGQVVQERLGDLAARAILRTNKKNPRSVHGNSSGIFI
jgi:hypothetical protein